jgi:hypothetical protein
VGKGPRLIKPGTTAKSFVRDLSSRILPLVALPALPWIHRQRLVATSKGRVYAAFSVEIEGQAYSVMRADMLIYDEAWTSEEALARAGALLKRAKARGASR